MRVTAIDPHLTTWYGEEVSKYQLHVYISPYLHGRMCTAMCGSSRPGSC